MNVKVGHINLPRHADKTQLVAPLARGEKARAWMEQEDVDVCGVVELWSVHQETLKRGPNARCVMATANNLLRHGQTLGTGIRWNNTPLRKSGNLKNLKVPMPGRPRGLNMPQLAFHVRTESMTFDLLVVHAPRKKDDPGTNNRVLAAAIDRLHTLSETHGRPAILCGDFNDGTAWRELERNGIDVGVHHSVDAIAGIGVKDWRHERAHVAGVNGVWSDHAALTVVAVM